MQGMIEKKRPDIGVDLLFEMKAEFGVQLMLDAPVPKKGAQTQRKLVGPAHHSYLSATIGSTFVARRAGM